jgi:adsorption protein B
MVLWALDAAIRGLAYGAGGGILVNQLDELFIDGNYFFRGLYRKARRPVPRRELLEVHQLRIAILVPAWREAEVIAQMLEHNLSALDYDRSRYDIFCGTYRNDPDTQARVDAVARAATNIHKVVVPHDGPTSKADCLNWVYQGVVLEEQRRGQRFDVLLMHDAEDLIHPLSLRLYSLLIPDYDFVQTPVFSLELEARALVAGTYIDEFAEHHQKDMLVRQAIGGLVPSAGVGSAFARDAFEEIAVSHGQRPFNTESLTEDYEIGLKFRLAGKRVCFALRTVEAALPGAPREEYIATREYFPGGFRASVRQRSRWILGITLQTWEQIGWQGPAEVRYCLFRDRKALFTSALLFGAYLLLVAIGVRSGAACFSGAPGGLDALWPPGSPLRWILRINLCMLAWRVGTKAWLVRRLYGTVQALLSAPRMVLGNVISLLAVTRAVSQYVGHRITGAPLRWLKTAHVFPNPDALRARRPRLGELLLEQRALDADEIAGALALQKRTGLRLGELLVLSGSLTTARVVHALGELLEMPTVTPDPGAIPLRLLARLPERQAEQLDVLPLSGGEGEPVVVAVAAPLVGAVRARIEEQLGDRVQPALVSPQALRRARARAYRRALVASAPRPRLGERLVAEGAIEAARRDEALAEQAETGEMLGEILLRRGACPPEAVFAALSEGGTRFRTVRLEEIDVAAARRLGCGLCAFHFVVPLRPTSGRRSVASAHPLHPQVLQRIAERLGAPVVPVLAPSFEVRLAIGLSSRSAAGARLGAFDAAELEAIAAERFVAQDLHDISREARAAGLSPIAYLESTEGFDAPSMARARARAIGISTAGDRAEPQISSVDVLPPGLADAHGISVQHLGEASLVLASPGPTPHLARAVARLFPTWAIDWQVLARQPREPAGERLAPLLQGSVAH